jgi:molybdate transport system regulatory protein
MRIGYKIWLDSNGKAFGDGPYRLLRLVDKTGSLHRAAAEMNMSYRKAWLMLNAVEGRLGFSLITRRVGGIAGGGSILTAQAREFLDRYEAFHEEVGQGLQKIYAKHFGSDNSWRPEPTSAPSDTSP